MSKVWPHLSPIGRGRDSEYLSLERAEGAYVYDTGGERYLDALSGTMCVNVGYGRREIADAAAAQMRKLSSARNVMTTTGPTDELGDKLCRLSGMDRVFLTSGGSEAVETAMKLARHYFRVTGEPRRTKFVARRMAYHGSSFGALSLTGIPSARAAYEPLLPDVRHVDLDVLGTAPGDPGRDVLDLRPLQDLLEFEGPDTIAALFIEPLHGNGRPVLPEDGFFTDLRRLCDQHGILLVCDEVVCAFGRTGAMFSHDQLGFRPDLVTVAKGLTSGYVPAGALLIDREISSAFEASDDFFRHIFTFGQHPVTAAVALANLDILEREDLASNAVAFGDALRIELHRLGSPLVGVVRGLGCAWAIELLDGEGGPMAAADAARVAASLVEHRVLARVNLRGAPTLQIVPPLVCGTSELDQVMDGVGEALRAADGARA